MAHTGRRHGRFRLGGWTGTAGGGLRPAGGWRSVAADAGGDHGGRLVVPAGRLHAVQPGDRQAGRWALSTAARSLARTYPTQIPRLLPGAGVVDRHVRRAVSDRRPDPGTTTATGCTGRRRPIWLLAVGGEALADRQLAAWRAESGQPWPHLPGWPVALFPPSQLFLRVAALVELSAAGLGFAGVVADPARTGVDAVHPAQSHRHSLHRTTGAGQSRRRLSRLSAQHQRIHSLVPETGGP